jgi:mRNA interferase RelE/StbE
MSYEVFTPKDVRKQLFDFPDDVIVRILEHIETLAQNPRPQGVKKLRGGESYRIRVGDYRIVYDIDDDTKP